MSGDNLMLGVIALGAAALMEWRLRTHLGDARAVVKALRAHVDSFGASWDALDGKIKNVSNRVDLLSQGQEALSGKVESQYQALKRAKIL